MLAARQQGSGTNEVVVVTSNVSKKHSTSKLITIKLDVMALYIQKNKRKAAANSQYYIITVRNRCNFAPTALKGPQLLAAILSLTTPHMHLILFFSTHFSQFVSHSCQYTPTEYSRASAGGQYSTNITIQL